MVYSLLTTLGSLLSLLQNSYYALCPCPLPALRSELLLLPTTAWDRKRPRDLLVSGLLRFTSNNLTSMGSLLTLGSSDISLSEAALLTFGTLRIGFTLYSFHSALIIDYNPNTCL